MKIKKHGHLLSGLNTAGGGDFGIMDFLSGLMSILLKWVAKMKTLIYNNQHESFKLEVFKDMDIDELTGNAYEIIGTNLTTGESDSVTTNTPQGAIALVDNIILELEHSSRRIK